MIMIKSDSQNEKISVSNWKLNDLHINFPLMQTLVITRLMLIKWEISLQWHGNLPLVPHICVSELDLHWLRWWLVPYFEPSPYLKQCWVIVNWTFRNKLQWNLNQNTKLFFHENACENIVCEMAAILSRRRWVNSPRPGDAYMRQ